MNKIFLTIGPKTQRFEIYRKLNPKLLIFASRERANTYYDKTLYWSQYLSIGLKYRLWRQIKKGEFKNSLLASRHGLLLPFKKLETIVIDDPLAYGHKQETAPKYHSLDVAKKVAEIYNARLIVGLDCLTPDYYYLLQSKFAQKIAMPNWSKPRLIFSSGRFITKLPKGSNLIFVPRKGEYRSGLCQDCQNFFILANQISCPICKSINIKNVGAGVEHFQKLIDEKFNQRSIIVDADHPLPSKLLVKTIIATHKIFDYNLKFENCIAVNFDYLLDLPDPFESEKIFDLIHKLKHITLKRLEIFTKKIDHPAIKYCENPILYNINELKRRENLFLPPQYRLLKLYSINKNPIPKITEAIKVSPIHLNNKGEYQVLVHLPQNYAITKITDQIKGWLLDPDPITTL